jgi:hypothetical protein
LCSVILDGSGDCTLTRTQVDVTLQLFFESPAEGGLGSEVVAVDGDIHVGAGMERTRAEDRSEEIHGAHGGECRGSTEDGRLRLLQDLQAHGLPCGRAVLLQPGMKITGRFSLGVHPDQV